MKSALLGIGLALASLFLALALRKDPVLPPEAGYPDPKAAANSAATPLPAEAVLSIQPGVPRPAAAAPSRAMSAVVAEYKQEAAFKPLYERLSSAPRRSAEEDWVLASILDRCARVAERAGEQRWSLGGEDSRRRFEASLSPKDPQREKRLAAFARINHDPCEGLTAIEATAAQVRAILERSAAQGDPKARARLIEWDLWPPGAAWDPRKLPSIGEAQLAELRQIVASGDANAMLVALRILGGELGNLSLRIGPEELPVDAEAWQAASILAACDHGYRCGADNPRVLADCATRGQCGARDVREHLFYYGASPSGSQLAFQYHEQIARAARGDWSGFTFHPGPSPAIAPFRKR